MEPEQPVSDQIALGEAGACPSVEWNGKRYTLGHPTPKAKAFYCDGLVEAERRGIEAQLARKLITPAKYDEKIDVLGRAIDRNEHLEGGAIWQRYAIGKDAATGNMLYLWSLFAQHHPELTLADVEALSNANLGFIKLALKRVCGSFFTWVGEVLKLPPAAMAEVQTLVSDQLQKAFGETPPPPTSS